MLYGENPLARETDALPFSASHTWSQPIDRIRYIFYDRKLNIALSDGTELWLRGVVPETENVQQLQDIMGTLNTVIPIIGAIAVLAGWFLVGRLLSPLRKIEEAASRISRGTDLKERIDLGDGEDELHKLADAFNRMFDRLDHAFETERRFTSDASHELRTPMSVIMAQCEVALEEPVSDEEYRGALRTIRRQGARMNGLINDMLDYTRLDQSAERYPLTEQDLSEIVSETSDNMGLLHTNDISLTAEVESGILISGNHQLLVRMLQNLISNAYRYGKKGGLIEVRLRRIGGRAELTVRDDGIGIAEEDQKKIFDRFYRGDASRSVQGTGLGLSMVQKIAELHKAEISVQSRPDEGSTFRVIFRI